LDSHQNHGAYVEVRSKEPSIQINIPIFQSLQQLVRMFELSLSIEDFLQEFLKLLVPVAKCLKSKDDQNSTKTKGHVTEKIKLEVEASL
jgi:hypothetical protein